MKMAKSIKPQTQGGKSMVFHIPKKNGKPMRKNNGSAIRKTKERVGGSDCLVKNTNQELKNNNP